MYQKSDSGIKIIKLTDAFVKDGFNVVRIINKFGKIGMMAESLSASNYDTKEKKKAFYIEGSSYEMGFLLGTLAENDISSMTTEYTGRVVFSFINSSLLERIKILQNAFISIVYELSKKEYKKLPQFFKDELQGIYDGCRSTNTKTKVTLERLVVLNLGIDILCSMVYSGHFPLFRLKEFEPEEFKIPIMCNAFSVFGKSAGGGHYFGRDFMFPSADVFHKLAAMIIYNPTSEKEAKAYPFVSVTAPGIIGCISGMNTNGIGFGVDMSPGANCTPRNVGINSLLLLRLCTQNSGSAHEAVKLIKNINRGVSWNYVVADGKNNCSCIVEAGSTATSDDFISFVAEKYKNIVPNEAFISVNKSAEFDKGVMVRWNNYSYPEEYLKFNEKLWERYNELKKPDKQITIEQEAFSENGFINKTPKDDNCPSAFYFAPQREKNDELLIVANHYIIPEMRYYAMHKWTSRVTAKSINNMQWRYDELNSLILRALKENGFIDYQRAKELIDYLSPKKKYPDYYAGNPRSIDGKEIRIEGCVSVFDLKKLIAESHYGYYCDEWVKITLSNYIS